MTTPSAPPICLHCGGSGVEQDFDEEEVRPPDLSDGEYRRWLLQREYRPRIIDCLDKYLKFGRMARLSETQGAASLAEDLGVMLESAEGMLEARQTARRRRDKSLLTESTHAQLFVMAADIIWFLASRCYPADYSDVMELIAGVTRSSDEGTDPDADSCSGK